MSLKAEKGIAGRARLYSRKETSLEGPGFIAGKRYRWKGTASAVPQLRDVPRGFSR
jgi:hypothetical protein